MALQLLLATIAFVLSISSCKTTSEGTTKLYLVLLTSLFLLSPIYAADYCKEEGVALRELRKSFGDANNTLLRWMDFSNHCHWTGVSCDPVSFHVIALNLSGLNISGEISPAIAGLKALRILDLHGNRLSGQIPGEIGNCSSLEEVYLTDNQLFGAIPGSFSMIRRLHHLELSFNRLSGGIPSLIYRQNKVLRKLALNGNKLTGTLSPDVCYLPKLWYLDVGNNSLTGHIPPNIGNCSALNILDLSHNQLSGEVPFSIGFLPLILLELQGNKLTGQIPSHIGDMKALTVLDLSCNFLNGPIPKTLGNLPYILKIFLQGNELSGSIPPELGSLTSVSNLVLHDNKLTGLIPSELGKFPHLYELNMANNKLEGPIPDNLSSCSSLNILNLHGNKLNGTIPSSFKRLWYLTQLILSSNNLSGPIPIELSQALINLDTLDLSNNEICGSIPSPLGRSEHLLKLNLSKNRLVGSIPAEFGNLRAVQVIDISYNNISGLILKEFGQLSNLISLNVSYNNLTGEIPIGNFSWSPESFIGNPDLCGPLLNRPCYSYHSLRHGRISKAVIIGISVGGSLVIAILILVGACRRHSLTSTPTRSIEITGYTSSKLVNLRNMDDHGYEDILRLTDNFSETHIIGQGSTSVVYNCQLRNGKVMAIKRSNSAICHSRRDFETELKMVWRIKHRNMLSLQAYYFSSSDFFLCYEFMENGSLLGILHDPDNSYKLDWIKRMKIALGVAEALLYLHKYCDPPIIHRDVKSANILLDDNLEPHLTDLGIAKLMSTTQANRTSVIGTMGYIDPAYANFSHLTTFSDVFSYGIVLLELLTGRKAVDGDCNLRDLVRSKKSISELVGMTDIKIKTDATSESLIEVFKLALRCTRDHSYQRPDMEEVKSILTSLIRLFTIPSVPQLSIRMESTIGECSKTRMESPDIVEASPFQSNSTRLTTTSPGPQKYEDCYFDPKNAPRGQINIA